MKESTKNKPCQLCKKTEFNYKQYGQFYCNNPEHSPRRIKKSLEEIKSLTVNPREYQSSYHTINHIARVALEVEIKQ